MRARRIGGLLAKESLQVVRDPSSILVAFVLPVVLLFLFGFAVSLDPDELRIGVVVEDDSPLTLPLVESFRASRSFRVAVAPARQVFESRLARGDLDGIVVIPADFSRRMAAGGMAPIQVLTDGSQPAIAHFVPLHVRGVVATWAANLPAAPPPPAVTPIPRMWFNPAVDSRDFLIPGSVAVIMTMIGTLLTALVLAREWERGTMEALMATPAAIAEILIGKLLPYVVLAMLAMALTVAVTVTVFAVPLRGSIGALVLLSLVFLIPALGQGLLISTLLRNQFAAAQAAILSGFLPAFLLSGFVFDINSMPEPVQWVTYVLPARYFVASLQTLFLVGDVWAVFLPSLGAMAAIGVVLLALISIRTRKRLD